MTYPSTTIFTPGTILVVKTVYPEYNRYIHTNTHDYTLKGEGIETKTVVVDAGRSGVKVLFPGDGTKFIIPSVVAPGRKLNMPVKENDPLRALHVAIGDMGEYFVGEFAIRQGEGTQNRGKTKVNENNKVLVVTAASIFANPGDELAVATNCPALYWDKQWESLAASLSGKYRVKHERGFLAGVTHDFSIQAYVMPEGAAAFFGTAYDLNLKPVRPELLAEGACTVVVDIGDTTVNAVTMIDQDYQDKNCTTTEDGLHVANAEILKQLQAELDGLTLTLPELEQVLRQPVPTFHHGKAVVDLTDKRHKQYSALAGEIASHLQAQLKVTPQYVLLVGGGGAALANYLRDRFTQSEVICPDNAEWLNAFGMAVMMGLMPSAA
jgi:hypothetical protein